MGSCKLWDEGEILTIKSCNDFIKLPTVYLRDLISERLKFLSPQLRRRDFRFTPTSSGEFKFKVLLPDRIFRIFRIFKGLEGMVTIYAKKRSAWCFV